MLSKTSSGKVAKVYSIGLAIGNLFDKDNIVEIVSKEGV